jgi:ATP-dependent helicase/nuclease subunit A
MAGFVMEFEAFFVRHRKATSSLEFEDLLFLARTMLRDNPGVREYFKRTFKYLFVDETQDIDPLQTEVVFFLSEQREMAASSWTDVRLEPGKLFMVGDPKQSIYKFRRADITVYAQAKECVEKQGGRVLTLDRNFRSAAPIIGFVNDHFQVSFGLFAEEMRDRLQPSYTPLQPAALRQSGIEAHVYVITSPDSSRKVGRLEALDIEITRLISFLVTLTSPAGPKVTDAATGKERTVEFRDVMVLMKTFTDVEVFARKFELAGIPYQEVGGKTFFVSDDVRGMVFALKAIDDPTDTISLFGALKSPGIGVTDQELFDCVGGGKRLSIFTDVAELTGTLPAALMLFKTLHYTREKLRPSGVLKELLNVSGLCHVVLAEPNGLQKSAKYFRLLELLHEIESDQTRSFRSVVTALEAVMEMDDPQLANVTITPSGENAVKLTTIHRAKGLEAPVVVLANATITPRKVAPEGYVLRGEGKILIPYDRDGGFYSRDPDELLGWEERKEECEAERLRYVAATRARDILVVCIPSQGTIPESFNGRLGPTLLKSNAVERVEEKETQAAQAKAGGRAVDLSLVLAQAREAGEKQRQLLRAHQEEMPSPFVSVHDIMEIDPDLFKVKRKSRGKGYGIVLHKVMQLHVMDPSFRWESVLDQWMEEEDVPRRFRDDMLRSLAALASHPHVISARQSGEKHCEWEFFTRTGEHILGGVIDLVYKGGDGSWTIVDYKTDDVSTPARRQALDALYGKQLDAYAAAFERIAGGRVTHRAIIYSEEEAGEEAAPNLL